MVYLPNEIKRYIIDLSYKMLYNSVLCELEGYIPKDNTHDFYYPFKKYILNFSSVVVFDDDDDFLSEIVFFDIPDILILS